jgi:hypothetical protein
MAVHTAPVWIQMKARVPRGYEDFWQLILMANAARGEFITAEIADATNVQRQSVEHYVARLVAGGFAALIRRDRDGPVRINVYKLLKKPKAAPRLREDGSVIKATTQEALWAAMRALKKFTTRELAYAATTDDEIPAKTAQRYVNQLADAGYFTIHGLGNKPKEYWLKPAMNTGPRPPSILVTEAVWDRNLKQIVGQQQEAREVAI